MNYELAEKLKDAGFPQVKNPTFRQGYWYSENEKLEEPVYIPTLSELIEACKGRIIKLWILSDGRAGVQLEGQGLDDVIHYSTPEEAVARLWIELHK